MLFMVHKIYPFILGYFLLGALAFVLINRRKPPAEARQNWLKYSTYFVIIHLVFFSIVIRPHWFRLLGIIILIVGCVELIMTFRNAGRTHKLFFYSALCIYALFSAGFLKFGSLPMETILFAFLLLSIFDAFSQLSGQMAGRTRLFPRVSPGKTVEGLIGGVVFAMGSALLLSNLEGMDPGRALALATGVVAFAFAGDFLASLYKRRYGIKDFSRLLPGQGGFLDRFDSLIAGGSFLGWYFLISGL
jgi:phosphatidate cytidylyltransferase